MIERKLKIDLSPLWNEPTEKFIVRFQDINEKEKRILAQRIKDVAQQRRIKSLSGPTVQLIYKTLTEINPIIFGEYNQRNHYRPVQGHKVFNMNVTRTINGYNFKNLCQAIYLIDCLKRDLNKKEVCDIAYLTCQDWDQVNNFVNENYRIRDPEEMERRNIIEEIEISDVTRARKTAENGGANNIPDGMLQEEEIDYEAIDQLVDQTPRNLGRGILNEIVADGATHAIRTMTEQMYQQRPRPQRRNTDTEALEAEIERIQSMRNTYTPGSRDWVNAEEDKITRINDLRRAIEEIRRRDRPERLADRAIRDFAGNFQTVARMEPAEDEPRPFYGVDMVDGNTFQPAVRRDGFMIVDEVDPN